ncbi:uncharacterized protein LOC129379887 [Poeciliopsis prolifica]|uniref:uncharacterized protein LOC129379887 n=1 Tax=Poeciliopsis prolifica TaxID=188132 RepID=UPI002413CED1|nr:uncharacterized protein LOC129379887 [Poeciliopsis prolifica]
MTFLIPGRILVHYADAYHQTVILSGREPDIVRERITSFVSDSFQFYSADSANMPPSVLLLLLLISGAQASFYGVVFNYAFGNSEPGGYAVPYDFKVSFSSCAEFDTETCNGFCTGPTYSIDEVGGEWCQKGYSGTFSYPYLYTLTQSVSASPWTENRNGIVLSTALLQFDLRNRSDINKPNSSPRTTILPLVRVPSNCQRSVDLLVSDPDGDDSRCRYAAFPECNICTPPSVLTLSSSCSLSFRPTNSSVEGPYAVQMVVEDFPRQNVILTDSFGSQGTKTTSDSLSSMPVQFVFRVDPAAPSCTAGEYLPRFLPPTPQHGAQIFTNVNQTLEISVRAEATQAETTELLFSGPLGFTKRSSGPGNFSLTWTPSASDEGQGHHLCFVVQANSSGSVYQSDLRCIVVRTGNSPVTASPPTTTSPPPSSDPNSTPASESYYVLALNAKLSTSLSLNESAAIINLIQEELQRQGLPAGIIVEMLNSGAVAP